MGKKRGKCVKSLQDLSRRLDKEIRLRSTKPIPLTKSDSGRFALIGDKSDARSCLINSSSVKAHFCGHTEPTFPVINQKTSLQRQQLLFLVLRLQETSTPPLNSHNDAAPIADLSLNSL